jgi:hypothetical protein
MEIEQIEQQIKAVGIDLQNNAKVIAELMAKQRLPHIGITIRNFGNGFKIDYRGGYFPDGENSLSKDGKNIKEAIMHAAGFSDNGLTPVEIQSFMQRITLYNSEPEIVNT